MRSAEIVSIKCIHSFNYHLLVEHERSAALIIAAVQWPRRLYKSNLDYTLYIISIRRILKKDKQRMEGERAMGLSVIKQISR